MNYDQSPSGSKWETHSYSITSGMSLVEQRSSRTSQAGIHLSITPLLSAPHPCNHVSSYIIAFQLLTGVWPLPPNMPNLIHVFPKRQRDALFSKRKRKKNMQCRSYKKRCQCFLLLSQCKCSIYFQRDIYCILWWCELSGHWARIEDERKKARAVNEGHYRGAT